MFVRTSKWRERGNVLFLILIAVALFAALSYAVTSSNRAGGGSAENEKAALIGSEIVNYSVAVRTAVTKLIALGCGATEISFEKSPFDGSDTDYVNPNSPADFTCHVFHPNGGGAVQQNIDPAWLDSAQNAEPYYGEYLFTGRTCIPNVGTGSAAPICHQAGGDHGELIMFAPYLSLDICEEINSSLLSRDSSPAQEVDDAWRDADAWFRGAYLNGFFSGGRAMTAYFGEYSGCFEGDNQPPAGSYSFYSVLLAR